MPAQLGSPLSALALGLALTLGLACSAPSSHAQADPPAVKREFRGAWIATVANIDWPSRPGLPTPQAKAELIAILDQLNALNMNAMVLQVRPTGDALYKSELEPWSEWLTGAFGKAPDEDWDPLAFAIEEAHARGIELHAWFNPYRQRHLRSKTDVVAPAIGATHPELVKTYGKYLWMDPGEPKVIEHSLAVMLDVVKRYDVDGIHLDDYFYPYPIKEGGKDVPFPDGPSWKKYQATGGTLSRDDWRRDSVNRFVEELYRRVKAEKPHVMVGISPFGIYRPGQPAWAKGFDQYDKLYADPLLWFQKGWLDYLTPQLYWPIDQKPQSFTGLLAWWDSQNKAKRHVWPGMAIYRYASDKKKYPANEFVRQINASRELTTVSDGHIHFSGIHLMPTNAERTKFANFLKNRVYAEPALPPESPWLAGQPVQAPEVRVTRVLPGSLELTVDPASVSDARTWVAQVQRGGTWVTAIIPASQTTASVETKVSGQVQRVSVFAVGLAGVTSSSVEVGRR